MKSEDFEVLNAMRVYGGAFVATLGEAGLRADSENLLRLKVAWPEYWAEYAELAKKREKKVLTHYPALNLVARNCAEARMPEDHHVHYCPRCDEWWSHRGVVSELECAPGCAADCPDCQGRI